MEGRLRKFKDQIRRGKKKEERGRRRTQRKGREGRRGQHQAEAKCRRRTQIKISRKEAKQREKKNSEGKMFEDESRKTLRREAALIFGQVQRFKTNPSFLHLPFTSISSRNKIKDAFLSLQEEFLALTANERGYKKDKERGRKSRGVSSPSPEISEKLKIVYKMKSKKERSRNRMKAR